MQESDIDGFIKNYWNRAATTKGLFDDRALNEIVGTLQKFWNPDNEHPMRLAQFLSYLDTTAAEREMLKYYDEPSKIKYLRSMCLSLIFKILSPSLDTPGKLVRHLKKYPEDTADLDFKLLPNRRYEIPSGETFRYNAVNRFGDKGMANIKNALLRELVKECAKHGIIVGQEIGEDAFPIKSLAKDNEADYSGHYKMKGYKCNVAEDYNLMLPLEGSVIGINEDEGKRLISDIQSLKENGIQPEDGWVDGKYTSTENIAKSEIQEGVRLHYKINDGWIYHSEANLSNIQLRYQTYHQNDDFKANATLEFMMKYLVKHGDYEIVGNMLRNDHIAIYEECPDGYLNDYHERNKSESVNDFLKNHMGLSRRLHSKCKSSANLLLQWAMLGIMAVALIRVQHGIFTKVASLDGFT